MATTNEKLKQLQEIHRKEETLYKEKNEKYGDSFSCTFQKHGPLTSLLRLEDKLNRVESLVRMGLEGSNGESLVDTLMDLSNYANMTILELMGQTQSQPEEKAPHKKRTRKSKVEKGETPDQEPAPQEKGPFDDLSKAQMVEAISALGGTVPKKANRNKLIEALSSFPKAKVAVVLTAMKKNQENNPEENPDASEG